MWWFVSVASAFNLLGIDWTHEEHPIETPWVLNTQSFPPQFYANMDDMDARIFGAFDAWNTHPSAAFYATYAGPQDEFIGGDSFELFYGGSTGGGTLAQAITVWSQPPMMDSCDIEIFDRNGYGPIDWYFGEDPALIGPDQTDFQSVITHELGHCIGINHSGDSGAVMAASILVGTTGRELTTDDDNALISIYQQAKIRLSATLDPQDGIVVSSTDDAVYFTVTNIGQKASVRPAVEVIEGPTFLLDLGVSMADEALFPDSSLTIEAPVVFSDCESGPSDVVLLLTDANGTNRTIDAVVDVLCVSGGSGDEEKKCGCQSTESPKFLGALMLFVFAARRKQV